SCHELGSIGADEYYVADGRLQSLSVAFQRNGYVWAKDVYEYQAVPDWDNTYMRILTTNIVLEGLDKIKPLLNEQESWNNAKGSALFFRALNFYQLLQEFGAVYNSESSSRDLGIPLRLESDITVKSQRSTVAEGYSQIIKDLLL